MLDALKSLSATLGADPLLVQAAGGNSSIKQDDTLWIKASGTWLMHAEQQDIMVPVDYARLSEALAREDDAVEKAQDFVFADRNPSQLRPSIETTVHAVMPQRVVVHVHCVNTIAIAARADAQTVLADKLSGLDYVFVPYVRPGLPLAMAIKAQLTPSTNIVVLGNHGLVVAADTPAQINDLIRIVTERLAATPRTAPAADTDALTSLIEGSDYRLPSLAGSHAVACDTVSCDYAGGGSLYPDHVIFLGHGSLVIDDDEPAQQVSERIIAQGLPAPVSLLYRKRGVVMHSSAVDAAQAMALCLSDVTARIPAGVTLTYLSLEQNAQLLNWDAEKYRQTLIQQTANT